MTTANPMPTKTSDHLGQRYAFGLASLLLGIASFVHLLGVEKAVLAIVFGVLAVRPRVPRLRPGWARAGMILGAVMLACTLTALLLFHHELFALVERLATAA